MAVFVLNEVEFIRVVGAACSVVVVLVVRAD